MIRKITESSVSRSTVAVTAEVVVITVAVGTDLVATVVPIRVHGGAGKAIIGVLAGVGTAGAIPGRGTVL